MIKIFSTSRPDELVCPEHHIKLTYFNTGEELELRCDWCDYTLVPLTDERKKLLGI